MRSEWQKYNLQKHARGYLDKDEQRAMDYLRPTEIFRRLNAKRMRDIRKGLERLGQEMKKVFKCP